MVNPMPTSDRALRNITAVRLEGGIGDHILGMRVLKFVKMRHPERPLVIFSDSSGQDPQAAVAAMSPYAADVIKVYPVQRLGSTLERWKITSIRPADLAQMLSADLFIDACVATFMVGAARALDVPLFEILATRTELVIPASAHDAANESLRRWNGYTFVAVNLANGVAIRHEQLVSRVLALLLSNPSVVVLNLFTSGYAYPHSHEHSAAKREKTARDDFVAVESMCTRHTRMIPCVDLPIATVAALISRCGYFVGVDNGIKHLAWALQVPRTYFYPTRPHPVQALRVMPDVHRCLPLNCSRSELDKHLLSMNEVLQSRVALPRPPLGTSGEIRKMIDPQNSEVFPDIQPKGAEGQ
jgi:hypothetical protein